MKIMFACVIFTAIMLGLLTGSPHWWMYSITYILTVAVLVTLLSSKITK